MHFKLMVVLGGLSFITSLMILANFIIYLKEGRVLMQKDLWTAIQLWTIIILPIFFLSFNDIPLKNDCCNESAVFSPDHRFNVYFLIALCLISYVICLVKEKVLPPLIEVILNCFLLLGLGLNIILFFHFKIEGWGYLYSVFGTLPIILLYLMMLSNNQKEIKYQIDEFGYASNNILEKLCIKLLNLKPIIKYPILSILSLPIIVLISLFLLLFGQKPDSFILAFTNTYKHGFSQLNHLCDNVNCGGHFLCSVGAKGHASIVRPLRYGERKGKMIICNRQLLVSNAFEELVQERFPKVHFIIRKNYNKVGQVIHKYYFLFDYKVVSDFVYVLIKPLEIIFLLTLYLMDQKPENRIAIQYLKKSEREEIKKKYVD